MRMSPLNQRSVDSGLVAVGKSGIDQNHHS